ncbi:aminotransferase class V-fold PLP-dependent enzyme [Elongatibacter sediminis]|uniref:Aminotransferase class V-fold PLP-dependent enzyme n=1 Tax=Elongatibacter sediminis TaxID=3119006 RepID=A0AAW9RA15_9GAMM
MSSQTVPAGTAAWPLDDEFVRAGFPAFSEDSLANFAHFENAGGSYACAPVIDRLNRYYRQTKVQPYYAFAPSRTAGEEMDAARQRLAAWMNVDSDEVHFGPSTTQNVYVLAQALRRHFRAGDEIVVTNQDHEANIGAWRCLEDEGFVVREWSVDPQTGELDLAGLEAVLTDRTRAVAFTHCSNLVATINPARDWVRRIQQAGAMAIVDGVSYAPHGLPDLRALGADVYLFSLYKVYGPHLGVMYLAGDLNAELPNQGHFFNAKNPTARFTPAGPDHAQIAAVNGVIDYFEALYRHHGGESAEPAEQAIDIRNRLRAREIERVQPLLDYVASHERIRLIGRADARERAPTVSFTVEGMPSSWLGQALADRGLGVGVGDFYAYRLVEALGIDPKDGAVRASLVHYTSEDEVSRLISALDELVTA